nr:MAG TPA: Clr5 domain protein [Caudoviricetes sp.]
MEIRSKKRFDETQRKNYDSIVEMAFYVARYRAEKLYSCKATVRREGNYIVLKSYDTPVALYVEGSHNGVLYDFLRTEYGYTVTSSKHIVKFKKWLAEKGLYDDSTVYIRFIP